MKSRFDCEKTDCIHYGGIGCHGTDDPMNQTCCRLDLNEATKCLNDPDYPMYKTIDDMPKVTLTNKKSFVGSLVETNYRGKIDENTIARIKADVLQIVGEVDEIKIWVVPMKQVDVLYNRVLICWECDA